MVKDPYISERTRRLAAERKTRVIRHSDPLDGSNYSGSNNMEDSMSRRRNRTNRAGAATGMNYFTPQFKPKKKPREVRTPSGTCKKITIDNITQNQEEKQDE